jgi:UDP-glucose 4-epimerase
MDIAEAHILALHKLWSPGFHAYNIGTGTSYSVKQVCDAAAGIAGQRINLRIAPRRAGDPAILCASPKKLMNEFGWEPKHSSLEEIISGAWAWEQALCQGALVQAA